MLCQSVTGQSWLDIEEPDLFFGYDALSQMTSSSSVLGDAQGTGGGAGGMRNSGTCFRAACQKRGSSCAASRDVCVVPYTCSGEQQCSPTKSLGTECTVDQECNSNDFVISGRYCFQGECTELSREGYSCQGGKRCLGSLSCVNGVCQKAGLVMGEDCTNASCRVPLVCDTKSNRCVERPVRGENCSATLPCGLGLDCVEGMCVEQFSKDVGEKCGDRTCMLPLVCGTNTHTCIRASSPDTITQRRCSNTDDCPDDCECLCDWRTGTRHCSIKEAPSSNAIVLYNEMLGCLKSNSFSREACMSKTIAWVQSTTTNNTLSVTATPELYCWLGSSVQQTVSPLVILLTVTLLLFSP